MVVSSKNTVQNLTPSLPIFDRRYFGRGQSSTHSQLFCAARPAKSGFRDDGLDFFLATEATNRAENMCKRTASEGPKKQKNTIKNRIKKRSQIERRERKRRERQKQFERTRGRRNKMNGPQKKGMDGSTPRRSRASAHKTAVHTTRQSTHHPTKEQ
jgi:hypothetical protein